MNNKLLAALFALIGLTLIAYGLYLIKIRNSPISTNNTIVQTDSAKPFPVKVTLPSLGLDLPITSAKLENGKWPASKDSVSYWVDSPLPGEVGNSVIYGHNFPNLFGKLKSIKVGDGIKIMLTNGVEKHFKVVESYTVTPDQTHILEQTTDTRLTIYTCTGFLDSKRFVVIAIPTNE